MFTTVSNSVEELKKETAVTQQLLDLLTDASLSQGHAEGFRNLGQLAWHLVHNDRSFLLGLGLKFEAPSASEEPPAQASVIAEAYRRTSQGIITAVESQLSDARLAEVVTIFGQQWTVGQAIYSSLKHEIHHRGQLTILMRLAGLPVIGAYGPAKEQWANQGRPAPAF